MQVRLANRVLGEGASVTVQRHVALALEEELVIGVDVELSLLELLLDLGLDGADGLGGRYCEDQRRLVDDDRLLVFLGRDPAARPLPRIPSP